MNTGDHPRRRGFPGPVVGDDGVWCMPPAPAPAPPSPRPASSATTSPRAAVPDPPAYTVLPGEETCPECGWGISWHTGWGGPRGCTLTDLGVAQRNWDAAAPARAAAAAAAAVEVIAVMSSRHALCACPTGPAAWPCTPYPRRTPR